MMVFLFDNKSTESRVKIFVFLFVFFVILIKIKYSLLADLFPIKSTKSTFNKDYSFNLISLYNNSQFLC